MRVEKRYKKKKRGGKDDNKDNTTTEGGESTMQSEIKQEIDELDKFIKDLIETEERANLAKMEVKKQEMISLKS